MRRYAEGGTVKEKKKRKKRRSNRERKMDSDADVCQRRRGAVSKLSRARWCDLFMR